MFAVGIDLGGTNIRAGVVDAEGSILSRTKIPAEVEGGPEHVAERMAQCVLDAISSAGKSKSDISVVGIGSPGPLDSQTGIIHYGPNFPGWKEVPIRKMLSDKLGLPCFLENDANSAAWGEFWVGAGRDVENMVIFTLGTGVGGSIILDGKLVRGKYESAGHFGHVIVEPDGLPCGCGSHGCLEAYASATAVARQARELVERGEGGMLADIPTDKLDARAVAEAAEKGCEAAIKVLNSAGRYLGIALAVAVNLVNPELAVYAGGMSAAGKHLFGPLEKEARARSLKPAGDMLRIALGELGDDAGIVGAAGCAMERFSGEA